ncbi:MAG TPA: maleylpyruvate isomerase N-terminal domain-containing protein [Chitinophagaceae bacterium]|nr:maleylpyruvate isomerase N-terminal domain-containing protein [Chitinophagaceae bacterium]
MIHPSIIHTVHLFPRLDKELISLLKSLSPGDWELQTLAPKWKVKDVAAHLLDGNIRAISNLRDQYYGEKAVGISSYRDLVSFLDDLNADWVKAMRRMSPELIISFLELTGSTYCEVIKNLEPEDQAIFSVAWAGEDHSKNWFHIAREYTEKWHHQQQIRFAVGQTAVLFQRDLHFPFLDTTMRALPHHYRTVPAAEFTCIEFSVSGEGGGKWYLIRKGEAWELSNSSNSDPSCSIEIEEDKAWRIFTKGISRAEAEITTKIKGVKELGTPIFNMLAVMA